MQLSNKVEGQLQEILLERPDEKRIPHKRRDGIKDIAKIAKRGEGQGIKQSILERNLNPIIERKMDSLDISHTLVRVVKLPTFELVRYVDKMLDSDEVKRYYPDYFVTQTNKNERIELVAKQYRWAITPLKEKPFRYNNKNSVIINSPYPNQHIEDGSEFMLSELHKKSYYLSNPDSLSSEYQQLSELILKNKRNEIIEEVYLEKRLYVNKKDLDILSVIEANWKLRMIQ